MSGTAQPQSSSDEDVQVQCSMDKDKSRGGLNVVLRVADTPYSMPSVLRSARSVLVRRRDLFTRVVQKLMHSIDAPPLGPESRSGPMS